MPFFRKKIPLKSKYSDDFTDSVLNTLEVKFMGLMEKIFGTYSERELKRIKPEYIDKYLPKKD